MPMSGSIGRTKTKEKTMKKILVVLFGLVPALLVLWGCPLALDPGKPAAPQDTGGGVAAQGNLTISVGSSGDPGRVISSGAALPQDVLAALRYELTLTGPRGDPLVRTLSLGDSLSLTVDVGEWRIDARAYQDTVLAGTGSATFPVGPGTNSVRVPMNMEGTCYEITLGSGVAHGTVRANFTAAFAGTAITITAEEDSDAVFSNGTLKALDSSSAAVVSGAGTRHSFTMPASDVTLNADFYQVVRYGRMGGTGDGSSWANASSDLQKMMDELERIAALGIPGYTGPYTVKLGMGIYKPQWEPMIPASPGAYAYTAGGRDAAFILRNGVQVLGGYPLAGGDDAERNTIAYPSVLNGDNAYHVVMAVNIPAAGGTVLDGLGITGGKADGSGNITVDSVSIQRTDGGGIYNHNSSPVLTDVTISGNAASNKGGGMYSIDSTLVLTDVTISSNTASNGSTVGDGGGMFNERTTLVLTNATISGNTAKNDGGGMYTNDSPSLVLINVIISGNYASNGGGGMRNDYHSSLVLINVTIAGNDASGAFGDGGGINNSDSSNLVLWNSIIWGNTSTTNVGIHNGSGCSVTSNSSIVQDGVDPSPRFIASGPAAPTTGGDYRLQSGSPAVNTGDTTTIPSPYPADTSHAVFSGIIFSTAARAAIEDSLGYDLGGTTRVQGGVIDMGAYEAE
jgi:hypothetical protein